MFVVLLTRPQGLFGARRWPGMSPDPPARAAVLVAAVLLVLLQSDPVTQLTLVLVFAVAILGLNIVSGYAGQISLGQSAFLGLGAYVTAILVAKAGWPYIAGVPWPRWSRRRGLWRPHPRAAAARALPRAGDARARGRAPADQARRRLTGGARVSGRRARPFPAGRASSPTTSGSTC